MYNGYATRWKDQATNAIIIALFSALELLHNHVLQINIYTVSYLLTTPPMGDCLAVAVGLMGSEDPADSAF